MIVVIGGTSGIGLETALHLKSLGYEVIIGGRKDPGNSLLKFCSLDITDEKQVQTFFDNGFLVQKGKDVHFNTKSNKKRMLTVPFGEETNYIVSSYFKSDEGIESLKLLESKEKISKK